MYRSERSGVLGGLSRVRAISLNDAHTFCAPDQVGAEVVEILGLIRAAHAALGVRPAGFRLSLRGPGGRYVGDDAALGPGRGPAPRARSTGWTYVEAPGEAAFYGPKIDIQIVDAAGRESTISTIQLDFDKPERFDLSYTDSDGSRHRPVMVHRSLVGSMERLFAYLIEVHEGAFPAWYAPVQLAAAAGGRRRRPTRRPRWPAGPRSTPGCGSRSTHAGSLGARIRDAARRRVPYIGVFGAREAADGSVALRLRGGRVLGPDARRRGARPDRRAGRRPRGRPAAVRADHARRLRSRRTRPPALRPTRAARWWAAGSSSTTAPVNCDSVEPVVRAPGGEQLLVGALLDDPAVLHHQDQVGVADGGEPVRDDEAGPVRAQRRHRPLQQHLGAGVHRAGRLVQDQQRRLGQERPRDGDELLLAGADVAALLVDDGVVAVGEAAHEPVHEGGPGGGEDLLLGGVRPAVGDVVPDGAAEEPGVLEHHADPAAQVVAAHRGDVHPVEGDPPGVQLVEAHDQVDQRGLAGAGRPDDGHRVPRLGDQRQVVDQRLVRLVPEGDVLELDPPVRVGDPGRRGRVGALLVGVEHREDPLGRGHPGLQQVGHRRRPG